MRHESREHWLLRPDEVCTLLGIQKSKLQSYHPWLIAILLPNKVVLYVRAYVDVLCEWLEGVSPTPQLAKEFANCSYGAGMASRARGRLADEAAAKAKSNTLTTGESRRSLISALVNSINS